MAIEISGMEGIQAVLGRYAEAAADKLSQGIAEGCKIVEDEAKTLCPVSTEKTRPGGPHGELRASITSQTDGLEGTVGSNKEYAAHVEFGTHKMAAQPYLVPALISKADDVVETVKAAME